VSARRGLDLQSSDMCNVIPSKKRANTGRRAVAFFSLSLSLPARRKVPDSTRNRGRNSTDRSPKPQATRQGAPIVCGQALGQFPPSPADPIGARGRSAKQWAQASSRWTGRRMTIGTMSSSDAGVAQDPTDEWESWPISLAHTCAGLPRPLNSTLGLGATGGRQEQPGKRQVGSERGSSDLHCAQTRRPLGTIPSQTGDPDWPASSPWRWTIFKNWAWRVLSCIWPARMTDCQRRGAEVLSRLTSHWVRSVKPPATGDRGRVSAETRPWRGMAPAATRNH
jgi:hypothetical protein